MSASKIPVPAVRVTHVLIDAWWDIRTAAAYLGFKNPERPEKLRQACVRKQIRYGRKSKTGPYIFRREECDRYAMRYGWGG